MSLHFKDTFSTLQERFQQSHFLKSVLTLSAGMVISQAVALLTTPIISRIYGPDILGDFSIITSNVTIWGVIVCLGLIPAIMVPQDDDEAKGICRLLAKGILFLSFSLFVVLVALSGIKQLFSVSINYQVACAALCVYLILNSLSSVCYSYVNRQKLYKVLFWNPSIGTISNAIICILLGLLGCGLWGYIVGAVSSSLFLIIHMLWHTNPFVGTISKDYSPIRLLKKHKVFPLVLLPSTFLGTAAHQVPIQMLSRYWGSFTLGSYSMCLTILGLPTKFLAGPVNRVFYREATERANNGQDVGEFSFRILKANVKIAIVPIVILIIFGAPLFSFVLGEKWYVAGSYASALGVYQALAFCNSCLSGKFIVINKKKTILFLNIIALLLYSITFLICHELDFSSMQTIMVYAIIAALFEMGDTLLFCIQAKVSVLDYAKFLSFYIVFPVALATMIRCSFL